MVCTTCTLQQQACRNSTHVGSHQHAKLSRLLQVSTRAAVAARVPGAGVTATAAAAVIAGVPAGPAEVLVLEGLQQLKC